MALSVKKGTFTCPGTSPQAITGVGFQPKAIIVFTVDGPPSTTDVVGSAAWISFGVSSAADSRAVWIWYPDNVATSDSGSGLSAILGWTLDGSSAISFTLSSFDADGFTIAYTNAAAQNGDVVHYIALGGTDLTDAKAVSGTIPTTGTTFDVTGFGFQPDALVAIFTPGSGTGQVGIGVVDTAGNEACAVIQLEGLVTMASNFNNNGYFSATSAIVFHTINADTLDAKADFNAWLADGVRFNNADAPAATRTVYLLGLKGGQYKVGSKAKIATAAADTFTTTGITPKGVLLFAADDVVTADTVTLGAAGLSIGGGSASDGTAEGYVATVTAETINTQADHMMSTTKALGFLTSAATATLQTAADLTALSSESFDLTWSATGTAELVGFMAMGETAPVPPGPNAMSPRIHPGLKTPGR